MTIEIDPHGVLVVVAICWIAFVYFVFTWGLRVVSVVYQWWDPPTAEEIEDSSE